MARINVSSQPPTSFCDYKFWFWPFETYKMIMIIIWPKFYNDDITLVDAKIDPSVYLPTYQIEETRKISDTHLFLILQVCIRVLTRWLRWLLNDFWEGITAWPDLAKFRHLCKILKICGYFVRVTLVFGKKLRYFWPIFNAIWASFLCCKWSNTD